MAADLAGAKAIRWMRWEKSQRDMYRVEAPASCGDGVGRYSCRSGMRSEEVKRMGLLHLDLRKDRIQGRAPC